MTETKFKKMGGETQ